MQILRARDWVEYELIDSGNGARLEKFGEFIIRRPDPQAIWKPRLSKQEWDKADASFLKTHGDKGQWKTSRKIPGKWKVSYKDLSFFCKLTPFKHTGVFPEQSIHWDFIREKIKSSGKECNILNLFGYTGIASLAAAQAGAKVTHVDASYPTIGWARENQEASGLSDKPIRWILDDALKFTSREIKRGVRYDGIIMDPPIYGHGPKGEKWDFEKSFPVLLEQCSKLLTDKPLFVIVNAYAISASSQMLANTMEDYLKDLAGEITCGELALAESNNGRLLSTGIFGRFQSV